MTEGGAGSTEDDTDTAGSMLRLSPCFDQILAALIPALVNEVVRLAIFSVGFHISVKGILLKYPFIIFPLFQL